MRIGHVRRFARNQRGAAVMEFALVVPILFLMVWGVISFSRAYQRLNTLTSSLREAARYRSTMKNPDTTWMADSVKRRIRVFSSAFGFPIDTCCGRILTPSPGISDTVVVKVTNYPLFAGLSFLGNLSSVTVSRSAVFRWERAP